MNSSAGNWGNRISGSDFTSRNDLKSTKETIGEVGSVYGKFHGEFPNDGITGEFSHNNYPHSVELNKVNSLVI